MALLQNQLAERAHRPCRGFSTLGCAALVTLLIGMPGVARAQTSSSSDATLHYNQGYDAMMRGDRARAYTELTQAWALQRTGETAGLLGQVERRLCLDRPATTYCDLYVDAARHLSFALRELPESHHSDTPIKVRNWLAEVKLQVGTLKIEAPVGAEVFVDGKSVGTAPLGEDVFVAPGAHMVTARSNGAELANEHIDIPKGAVQTVALAPQKSQPPGSSALGVAGGLDSTAALAPDPIDTHRPSLIPVYILGGVAIVGLSAGLLLHSSAKSAEQSGRNLAEGLPPGGCAADPPPAVCASIRNSAESHDSRATASTISFIAGGVGAAAAIGYAAYALWPRRASSAHAALTFDSHGTAFQISGSF